MTENGRKITENYLQVGLNKNQKITDTGIQSNVFRSIIHQEFDKDTLENDIAVLMLELQIKFLTAILPICLPEPEILLDSQGFNVGYQNEGGLLTVDDMKILSSEECSETDPKFFDTFLNDGNFCAVKETTNFCVAEPGSGFYVKNAGLWTLAGITSSSNRRNHCDNQLILTDVTKYLTWIDESVNSL